MQELQCKLDAVHSNHSLWYRTDASQMETESESSGRLAGRVTVYTIVGCAHCLRAKSRLKELGLPFCEVDVNEHSAVGQKIRELTGSSSVPQIYFNNIHVGGNDDFQKLPPEELQRLINIVKVDPLLLDAPPLQVEGSKEHEGDHKEGAAELSEALRRLILKMYADHLSADGKFVDYKAMAKSQAFEKYCELAIQLQRVELEIMSREEKLAFFINIYNTLVIHGHMKMGSPKNMWQRYRFFNYVSYLIGGAVFTLQDIENGILRGNRKGVAQLMRPFSKGDPRLQIALPDAEPLIHFALNCGAKGCPPIKTYTAKNIDNELRTAAEAFLENDGGCQINTAKGEVQLSQIFKWYKVDFGDTDEKLLQWILNHMGNSPKKKELDALLQAASYTVVYLPYDWSTNGKD
ncbi:uncharacterized protein zgc:152951 [Polyodon spathula]|uniref:uncharacterized protein zgc:152951 n=1 Tax=Polyodon spathula TaxID=7913 RepID=UPI001B7E902B|nr:uncharacterized protein zgc:152951 [Polyodon spathula]